MSIKIYNSSFENILPNIKDESIDIICIDPPYLYLKNQKLERAFNEIDFFSECKRILTKNGFIITFGRGESFYRWNTILSELKFQFKEEIVWDKSQCSSPLMALSRVHETISIFCKGKGSINKCKIPYLEMKGHDINSICSDIKRMRSILKNPKSLDAVLDFLENNNLGFNQKQGVKHKIQVYGHTNDRDRTIKVMNSIKNGCSEKSIIRTDRVDQDAFTKHSVTADKRQKGDRSADVMQGIQIGLNEKSIIKQVRDHYSAVHPTQKPVRLLERILQLAIPKDKLPKDILVADFFGGSFSTMEAVHNLGFNGISCEIDEEYFLAGKQRLESKKII